MHGKLLSFIWILQNVQNGDYWNYRRFKRWPSAICSSAFSISATIKTKTCTRSNEKRLLRSNRSAHIDWHPLKPSKSDHAVHIRRRMNMIGNSLDHWSVFFPIQSLKKKLFCMNSFSSIYSGDYSLSPKHSHLNISWKWLVNEMNGLVLHVYIVIFGRLPATFRWSELILETWRKLLARCTKLLSKTHSYLKIRPKKDRNCENRN